MAAIRSAPISAMVRSSSATSSSVDVLLVGVERWTKPFGSGSKPSFSGGMPVAASEAEATPW